jgi:hypothetical protein
MQAVGKASPACTQGMSVETVAVAWQRADAEQRLRVQNFLFQGGIAYHQNQKFLNTTNPTLFQQLRGLAHCERVVGVPDGI